MRNPRKPDLVASGMNSKRYIFQEVSSRQKADQTEPQPVDLNVHDTDRRQVRVLILILCGLTLAMVALGGMTRLTDSGLSITEWELVSGILPPLSESDWKLAFENYRQTPEFTLQNNRMRLDEFKPIYWWEWSHRQLGRLTGFVWAAGFIWLLTTGRVRRRWIARLLGLGALGAIQGTIGWWMVSSGLTGRMVDVASYRLAIHLSLAFMILGLTFWYTLMLGHNQLDLMQARRNRDQSAERYAVWIVALLILQVALGGIVAGTDAGQAFPTWPLMNGELLPSTAMDMKPVLANFFENPGLVQFNHRIVAYALLALTMFAWWRSRAVSRLETKRSYNVLGAAVILQVIAGIFTALWLAPVGLAIFHQLLAALLLYLAVRTSFIARFPVAEIQERRVS